MKKLKKNTLIIITLLCVVCFIGLTALLNVKNNVSEEVYNRDVSIETIDPAAPKKVILSGSYTCLPHLAKTEQHTQECVFGLKTDSGDYYAVNFGQSQNAMQQFRSGARITAEGFTIRKEALSSDTWAAYDIEGLFTITRMLEV